jgi:hypothetical protein
MQNNSFLKNILLVSIVVLFASCDKDFNEIGSDVIGDDHFGLTPYTSEVVAFNQNLGSMQSNNLPVNALGYYNNPVFGKTKASFVTQVELATVNPTFGTNPTVTKVELSVPYFSTLKETDAETGDNTYELDSIYGGSKIKLSVYESLYYLRDLDASSGFQEPQKYYSGDGADFDSNKNPNRLNDDALISQNDDFFFDNAEIITYKTVDDEQVVDTRSAPGMRLNLNKSFFQNKFFGTAAAGKLLNNNTFKEYFRGLYFKVENNANSPEQGSMAMMNFKQGKVTITYTVDIAATGTVPAHTDEKTLVVNLAGNTVNVFENTFNSGYVNAVTTGASPITGDDKLYLKGGSGSMAVIDIFSKTDIKGYDVNGNLTGPNGVSDELDDLRNPADGKKLLINEANLTFTIDRTTMGTGTDRAIEPNRIYLYDLNNNRPLIDYYTDISVSTYPKLSKFVHGGIIEKETTGTDKKGIRYKIRLTNHIRSLIKHSDSTNVRLGLVVTESIATITSAKLKSPVSGSSTIDRLPVSSVLNPLGTVLYGSKYLPTDTDYAKRLKLEIYYTKPN